MLFTRFYYEVKPLLPRGIRLALRRRLAASTRNRHRDIWPINEAAGKPPQGWRGWPDEKQFAVVLSHDVERLVGLERCRPLMEIEMSLGFRSSFNFVPEGEYSTPKALRDDLTSNGFEVGVHDLKHDGKLFISRKEFAARAQRINNCLKDWDAVGFRSGFMLRNLDWIQDLKILYDASTFDTDPFEPQPEGTGTIFPFWVPNPAFNHSRHPKCDVNSNHDLMRVSPIVDLESSGYVELPYTLVQDSTLFILLGENSIDLWKRKLDWIAKQGGMAFLIVHPDYLSFRKDSPQSYTYPAALYAEFLSYLKSNYAGSYWHALPREVARLIHPSYKKCAELIAT